MSKYHETIKHHASATKRASPFPLDKTGERGEKMTRRNEKTEDEKDDIMGISRIALKPNYH